MKPLVYICHPYSHGDQGANVHQSCLWWKKLNDAGAVLPHNPLWSAMQHTVSPESHDTWLDYDLDLIRRGTFDAIFRPNSSTPSSGCDRECELASEIGIPVFFTEDELNDWAEGRTA